MFESRTPAVLLDQQSCLLSAQLDGLNDGRVDAVHDARIVTRRIRELLALVPAIPGRDGEEDVASGYKRLGRALGKVRDIDVTTELLRNLEAHSPQSAPSLVVVRQDHERERLAKMRRLIKTLEQLDVNGLLDAVASRHPRGLRRRLASGGWQDQLRHLLGERACAATDRIAHATGVYFPNRAHSTRIAIKKLRYAAEIAEALGHGEMKPLIKNLRKGQEILGDLHDRQSLGEALLGYRPKDGIDKDQIAQICQVLDGEVLHLHARYLEKRPALRAASAAIEEYARARSLPNPAVAIGGALLVTGLAYGGRHWLARADGRSADAPAQSERGAEFRSPRSRPSAAVLRSNSPQPI
jgi:CHAD domain-containing protein